MGDEIVGFIIPNDSTESELKYVSRKITLADNGNVLEGTFEGVCLRRWVLENGIRNYVNDAIFVKNGYFKVSVTEEYEQVN
ncbi:MAG: hypothetical protein SPJ13_07680 [Bacteroidales bacterium]|nr:hypothetical protein [Bacteroidales bacterium]